MLSKRTRYVSKLCLKTYAGNVTAHPFLASDINPCISLISWRNFNIYISIKQEFNSEQLLLFWFINLNHNFYMKLQFMCFIRIFLRRFKNDQFTSFYRRQVNIWSFSSSNHKNKHVFSNRKLTFIYPIVHNTTGTIQPDRTGTIIFASRQYGPIRLGIWIEYGPIRRGAIRHLNVIYSTSGKTNSVFGRTKYDSRYLLWHIW